MAAFKTFLSSLVLLVLSTESFTLAKSQSEIPDFIHICNRNDPQIDDCVKKSVEDMKPYLKNGIPELRVPPMEPLDIGDLSILEGGAGGFTVRAKGLKIFGASDFQIRKFNVKDAGKRFDFDLLLPRLHGEGRYEMSGQLLALPLKGNGPFSGNFTNFMAFVRVKFEINKIEDVDFIQIKTLSVKIKVGKGRIRLENLFNGDKALGDIINDTINQNFEVFTGELIGPIERALEKKFSSIGSKIMSKYSYDQLFPV